MKWYFAGQFARLTELAECAVRARAGGLTITSQWLDQDPTSGYAGGSSEAGRVFAERDLEDIRAADGFLFFAEDPTIGIPRGGRHVESGVALVLGKTIELIAPHGRENIFHLLISDAAVFTTFEEWLQSKIKEAV
jgi:hypothetical protein